MWGDGAGTGAGGARFRALVVDDEPPLVQVVSGYLSREGFDVVTAADGETAVALARDSDPDVVVLDLMLPGIDGMEVCRRIRAFSDAYIIMLTAKSDEIDKLVGLSVGADDYLTKPFSPRELVARVRAMLRRPRAAADEPAGEVRRFGALQIDPARRNRPGRPLATRLFTAQALIVASGALTLVVVAVVIAPGLFRDHLQRAVGAVPPDLAQHLDQALARALLISLGIAVAAALAT